MSGRYLPGRLRNYADLTFLAWIRDYTIEGSIHLYGTSLYADTRIGESSAYVFNPAQITNPTGEIKLDIGTMLVSMPVR